MVPVRKTRISSGRLEADAAAKESGEAFGLCRRGQAASRPGEPVSRCIQSEGVAMRSRQSGCSRDSRVGLGRFRFAGPEPLEARRCLSVTAALGQFELFADAACTVAGMTGSYVNANLRGYAPQDDWRQSQTVAGQRVDATLDFEESSWGSRSEVGLTHGTDADWDWFSVQWDGYVRITSPMGLATRSDDSNRM